MSKHSPTPTPAPPPPAVTGELPIQFKWQYYGNGQVVATAFFVSPAAGNYLIQKSTDGVTWNPHGTWNPSAPDAVWNLPFSDDSLNLEYTAYRCIPA